LWSFCFIVEISERSETDDQVGFWEKHAQLPPLRRHAAAPQDEEVGLDDRLWQPIYFGMSIRCKIRSSRLFARNRVGITPFPGLTGERPPMAMTAPSGARRPASVATRSPWIDE
jgi:hypothetical protein